MGGQIVVRFRVVGSDESLACVHRDLSVCDACAVMASAASGGEALVFATGRHYWIPDAGERAELLAMVAGGWQ